MYSKRKSWKVALSILLSLPLVGFVGSRAWKTIEFNRECVGHIRRAADANTVAMAATELEGALHYLEKHQMMSGYTSIVYVTPNEDVGFWYGNLHSALEELRKVGPEASQLEKSNLLLKLRETLLNHTQNGEVVTLPPGINIFPDNVGYAWFGWLSLVVSMVGIILAMKNADGFNPIEIMIVLAIVSLLIGTFFGAPMGQ